MKCTMCLNIFTSRFGRKLEKATSCYRPCALRIGVTFQVSELLRCLSCFAHRRQKSWKQLLWKQRKIAHNRLECFSFDVSLPTALEAAFQKFKDVCFWGCLINSKTCLLLKARRYMKSAEAVEHAAKAWSFLKPVNFRKGDETWISMKTFMASKALTTER